MSVYKKLMEARIRLQNTQITKSGWNKYSDYYYFELGDFLPTTQVIFKELGLCGVVSYGLELATLTITDIDAGGIILITSPMSTAKLKACHEVQNLGAVETYIRRYLWITAMEIVEHDAIDSSEKLAAPEKETKEQAIKDAPLGDNFQDHVAAKETITPSTGLWEAQSPESQKFLLEMTEEVMLDIANLDVRNAVKRLNQLDTEEKAAIWTRFDSKTRAAMKKVHEEMKKEKA